MNAKRIRGHIAKVVRIDGRFHIIRAWHTDRGYELEPLGNALARNLYVEGEREPITFREAMLQAGWRPPGD